MQMRDGAIVEAVKNAYDKIACKETLAKIVSFIPISEDKKLDDIVYIIKSSKAHSHGLLLDLFMKEPDRASHNKLGYVISSLGGNMVKDIVPRIDAAINGPSFPIAIELYEILKALDLQEASIVAGKLIRSKNRETRSRMIEGFAPHNAEDKNTILEMLEHESDPYIRQKMLTALIKTKDAEIIKTLFETADKGFFRNKPLLELVTLCGTLKTEGSLIYLKKILKHKGLLNMGSARALRVQSILSLARIGTPEAIKYIMASANDRDKSVRDMCKLVLETDKEAGGLNGK
jgi:hypothetical protein